MTGVPLALGDAQHPADRRHERLGLGEVLLGAVEPGEMAAMPSSTSAGVPGMTRTTATPRAPATR